ncbi:MAG: hypothetical protein JWO77_3531 [Ilumatobacteraceae bacterium]|nr:hypothetical protein [Ilumatobacteraceae bacterium]
MAQRTGVKHPRRVSRGTGRVGQPLPLVRSFETGRSSCSQAAQAWGYRATASTAPKQAFGVPRETQRRIPAHPARSNQRHRRRSGSGFPSYRCSLGARHQAGDLDVSPEGRADAGVTGPRSEASGSPQSIDGPPGRRLLAEPSTRVVAVGTLEPSGRSIRPALACRAITPFSWPRPAHAGPVTYRVRCRAETAAQPQRRVGDVPRGTSIRKAAAPVTRRGHLRGQSTAEPVARSDRCRHRQKTRGSYPGLADLAPRVDSLCSQGGRPRR